MILRVRPGRLYLGPQERIEAPIAEYASQFGQQTRDRHHLVSRPGPGACKRPLDHPRYPLRRAREEALVRLRIRLGDGRVVTAIRPSIGFGEPGVGRAGEGTADRT